MNLPARSPQRVTHSQSLVLPLAPSLVAAGFPSPSQDYPHEDLDLSEKLITDRAATYIWEASGDSMTGAGIFNGSLLLVDRSIAALPGMVVVAIVDGEHTVKRLDRRRDGVPVLRAANPGYPDIELEELSELTIFGVVTWVISRPA